MERQPIFSNIPKNLCSFTGILKTYSAKEVAGGAYYLGKGSILISNSLEENGLLIKFNIWEAPARDLESVPLGSWITVVSSYSPSFFNGTLQDTFTVASFFKHND